MVLNPHGIESTFLKLDKEKKNVRKKKVLCIQKTYIAIFKNGFNAVLNWVQFPAYLDRYIEQIYFQLEFQF